MLAIWKRELQNYYLTPIGYVFMGIFLLVGGVMFYLGNIMGMTPSAATLLGNLNYIFMLTVPILTMRLLSEERRTKTDQLLITSGAAPADPCRQSAAADHQLPGQTPGQT